METKTHIAPVLSVVVDGYKVQLHPQPLLHRYRFESEILRPQFDPANEACRWHNHEVN